MEFDELYQEIILDHYRSPRNKRDLSHIPEEEHFDNPSCGDDIVVQVECDDRDVIKSVYFDGHGCAISQASASIMSEHIVGKCKSDVEIEIDHFISYVRGDKEFELDGDLIALDGVRNYPMRIKCATLAWHALKETLHKQSVN